MGGHHANDAAARPGVTRAALSRILDGSAGVSADMALRLRDVLGTSAEIWINMQAQYDLWQAEKKPRPVVVPFRDHVDALPPWKLTIFWPSSHHGLVQIQAAA